MNKIRTTTAITTLGLVAMMMAGCASAAGSTPSASGSAAAPSVSELRLGYFANVTHAPALVGSAGGHLQEGPRRREGDDAGVQRRTRRDRGAHRGSHRRDLHRPESLDQHLHPVGRRVGAHHRRGRDRRGRACRRGRHQERRRSRGQDPGDASARQYAGCRAARLARRQGLQDRHLRAAATCTSRRPTTPRR